MKKYKVVQTKYFENGESQPEFFDAETAEEAEKMAWKMQDDFIYDDSECVYEFEIEEVI